MNEPLLGKNIREARMNAGLSQGALSAQSGISQTQISAYENDKRRPSLDSLGVIASVLGVSLDSLYFGDESSSFIAKASSKGRVIVNCIYKLWELNVLFNASLDGDGSITRVSFYNCSRALYRLLGTLREFASKKSTFSDPHAYLEQVLQSVANEIDDQIDADDFIPF